MTTIAALQIRIGADISELRDQLQAAQGAFQRFNSRLNAAAPASRALLGGVAALAGALGVAGFAGLKMAGDIEQSRMAFTTLLGSAGEAKRYLQKLWRFAAETPFEFQGLQSAARQLLAFNFAAEDIIPTMEAVGNAVSGLGGGQAEIERVVRALGQMKAKGKVSAEEMMQLAELGIPAWDILAEKIGVEVPRAMELAEKGAIPAGQAIEALVQGMAERFPDMMEKQSQTLLGLFSTLKDNVSGILRTLGEEFIETFDLKQKLQGAIEAISVLTELLSEQGLKGALTELFPPEVRGQVAVLAGAIGGALVPAVLTLAGSIVTATLPLLPFIAAGAAAAGLAYVFYRNWDKVKNIVAIVGGVIGTLLLPKLVTLGVAAAVTAGRVVAAWTVMKVKAVASVATQVAQAWVMVAKWAWMGVQALFHAAKVAAAWVVALGPVGWVTAAVVALAAVVVANWQRIKEATIRIWGSVADWLGRTWERIKGFFKEWGPYLASMLLGPMGPLVVALVRNWDKVKGFLTDTWATLKAGAIEWGGNLIRGFWKGIVGLVNWIKEKIGGFIKRAIVDPVKAALGIKSPSRVLAEIGRLTAEGLAQGLEEGTARVREAAVGMKTAIVDSLDELRKETRGMRIRAVHEALNGVDDGGGDDDTLNLFPDLPDVGGSKEDPLQQALDALDAQLRIVEAEVRRATASLGGNADETERLTTELDGLQRKLDLSSRRAQVLQGAYDDLARTKGEMATETLEVLALLREEQATMAELQERINGVTQALDEQGKAMSRIVEIEGKRYLETTQDGLTVRMPEPQRRELTADERAQVKDIAERQGVDLKTAEDMLRANQFARVLGEAPQYGDGGIVRRPTLGIIGEKGPEAVIPLADLRGATAPADININITGNYIQKDLDMRRLARAAAEELSLMLRQGRLAGAQA